ncbi:MAG: polysaccharide deacetylase family protein [Clostridia bacterium]|nr:polysaccharide deacetylase family protein [Clostridia bacterium]
MVLFDRYKDGKQYALTFSYDDGCRQDRRLVELFNKYGFKATFNLFTNNLNHEDPGSIQGSELAELYKGHEIACHAYHHPHLERMTISAQYEEIIKDKEYLESCVGYIIRGMAFPFGTWNDDTLTAMKTAGIEYSRTVNSTGKLTIPESYATWAPTCHHSESEGPIRQFIYNIEKAPWRAGGLLYIWGHSYEFDQKDAVVNWEEMDRRLAMLAEHKDNIWSCTNVEVMDYLNAVKQLKTSANGKIYYNPTLIDIWVTVDGQPVCIKSGSSLTL